MKAEGCYCHELVCSRCSLPPKNLPLHVACAKDNNHRHCPMDSEMCGCPCHASQREIAELTAADFARSLDADEILVLAKLNQLIRRENTRSGEEMVVKPPAHWLGGAQLFKHRIT